MTDTKTTPKIIKVDPRTLIADPSNPNRMPAEEYAALVAVVKKTGMVQPILVDRREDGIHIVDGHHRAKAAEEAGIPLILAVVWDGTEEMRLLLTIGLNKIRGALDLSAVNQIMTQLVEFGLSVEDITATGYSAEEINDLLAVTNDVNPDDIMENPIAPPEDEGDGPAPKPFVLEIEFANRDQLKLAKKGLKRAAGKGGDFGTGLLALIGHTE